MDLRSEIEELVWLEAIPKRVLQMGPQIFLSQLRKTLKQKLEGLEFSATRCKGFVIFKRNERCFISECFNISDAKRNKCRNHQNIFEIPLVNTFKC